jgi:hypothetical protein
LKASKKTFLSKVSDNSFDAAMFVRVGNNEDVVEVKTDDAGSEELKV